MSTVLLANADRFQVFRLDSAVRAAVAGAGGACTTRMVGSNLEVTIRADAASAARIADDLVDWYTHWRRAWGRPGVWIGRA